MPCYQVSYLYSFFAAKPDLQLRSDRKYHISVQSLSLPHPAIHDHFRYPYLYSFLFFPIKKVVPINTTFFTLIRMKFFMRGIFASVKLAIVNFIYTIPIPIVFVKIIFPKFSFIFYPFSLVLLEVYFQYVPYTGSCHLPSYKALLRLSAARTDDTTWNRLLPLLFYSPPEMEAYISL